MDLTPVRSAPWLRFEPREIFFPWGWPKFRLGFFLAVLAGYLASIIESFRDYYACARLAAGRDPTRVRSLGGLGPKA
ncbi:MAG: solute carrier family 23 protein [Bryobacterales bacterium]|nr:solute carrier family 23 protein [Bryobacteraceae bacterium]MDW8355108.1 solute carrier family 23 protein [Bryobacterales bacterium]